VVAPDWRRKGVGRALIQRALERARSLSVKRIEVAPHPCDPEIAATFLSACGFQPTGGALMRFASAP
jgi:GNAT superfamily N-acetyltransferase